MNETDKARFTITFQSLSRIAGSLGADGRWEECREVEAMALRLREIALADTNVEEARAT